MNPEVTYISRIENHTLRLVFEGGEVREFDLKPYLNFGIFEELKDDAYLKSVKIEFGSIEWPNGQGLSHDTLFKKSKPAAEDTNA